MYGQSDLQTKARRPTLGNVVNPVWAHTVEDKNPTPPNRYYYATTISRVLLYEVTHTQELYCQKQYPESPGKSRFRVQGYQNTIYSP